MSTKPTHAKIFAIPAELEVGLSALR